MLRFYPRGLLLSFSTGLCLCSIYSDVHITIVSDFHLLLLRSLFFFLNDQVIFESGQDLISAVTMAFLSAEATMATKACAMKVIASLATHDLFRYVRYFSAVFSAGRRL